LRSVKEWARECDETHTRCHDRSSDGALDGPPNLPTRILDVGMPGDDPFLLVTTGQRDRYVALSHCWGGRNECITTKSTYEVYQRAIKLSSLSKTFQDAVRITHTLGMHYLWIDSLCILQDNEADWENEAANMGLIYEDASCTIAAAAASHGAMGCFAQDVDLDSTILLPAEARHLNGGDIYVAKNTKKVTFFDQGPLV
jgi:hypothetical protein